MAKAKKTKIVKKILSCPKCGGKEFQAEVGAYEVYAIVRGRLKYQRSVVTDETADVYRCNKCGAEAPEQLVVDRELNWTPNPKFASA